MALIGSFALRHAPGAYLAARSVAVRALWARKTRAVRASARAQIFPDGAEPRVIRGPFEGMRYDVGHTWGSPTNKWLGTYECEVADIVERIVDIRPANIFDLGCAEGYYAVGLARRLATTEIWAFDADPISLLQCRRLAVANGVASRIHLRGYCSQEILARRLRPNSVVISDIEGGEVAILDPIAVPTLTSCSLLVELHRLSNGEWSGPRVREHFRETHEISEIRQSRRDPNVADPALVRRAGESQVEEWMNEMRGAEQSWLWMVPRSGGSRATSSR